MKPTKPKPSANKKGRFNRSEAAIILAGLYAGEENAPEKGLETITALLSEYGENDILRLWAAIIKGRDLGRIPEALRDRTRFVSITIDPARDTPEVLRAYAEARGADLTGWSFLTGPVERVDAVLRAYGVGVAMGEGEEIVHTVATFLIGPDGEIEARYLGSDTQAATLRADVEALL